MRLALCILAAIFCGSFVHAEERTQVVIVVGAEGAAEYQAPFRVWAERWQEAAQQGGAEVVTIGLEQSDESDRAHLQQTISQAAAGTSPLWIVLIGHGTYDGKTAKFNLRGEDVSATELAQWLQPCERPLAFINCSSCSGAFLNELSGPQRVVVTATKSGHEYNFSRFGDYLSAAIVDTQGDLDKDDQTSLLEAFLMASANVREFYKTESRLATEHALIDDNGDRLGTPAEWFTGLKPTKAAKNGAALDGTLARSFVLVRSAREDQLPAEARARRDELERELAALRSRKADLDEAVYFSALETLLVELARLGQAKR